MKYKKSAAVFLAVITLMIAIPFSAFATSDVVFDLTSDVAQNEKVKLGDTVTFSVKITENSGFCVGSFYFKPSDNLTYVSSTMFGESYEAYRAEGQGNEGAYGFTYLEKTNYEGACGDFCTITFKVDGLDKIWVDFYVYDFRSAPSLNVVEYDVLPSSKIQIEVEEPSKPIIITETLSEAVAGFDYSFNFEAEDDEYISWKISSGALPEGLELLNDGTLSGKVADDKYGSYTFGVQASIFDTVFSDEKIFTLNVLEKPKKLELIEDSDYRISDSGFLNKVLAETTVSEIKAQFTNDNIKIYDPNGNEVTDENACVGTGWSIKLIDGETELDSIEVIVIGDINGDGTLGASDYFYLKSYCLGQYQLNDAYLAAAHITGSDDVGASDYFYLKSHCLGQYNIYA